MKYKMILFDLDGTLLPMDQEEFVKGYFGLLAKKLAPGGYQPKQLVDGIWKGISAMVQNDGSCSNETRFWEAAGVIFGEHIYADRPLFDEFYANEFDQAKIFCGYNPKAAETVRRLKAAGYRVALATNPFFPAVATGRRIRWCGLTPEDFELVTTYENIGYSKPNPEYYREVARRLLVDPKECLMVGNDVTEDLVAEELGMDVFLLTDCLINKGESDISRYPKGSFSELLEYIEGREGVSEE